MAECKFCGNKLGNSFLDLGMQPLCNNNVKFSCVDQSEKFYPLDVFVCSKCFLVQLKHEIFPEEIFSEYTYLSSYSSTWLEHARKYCENIISDLNLAKDSFVVELASNDGYLLQNFKNYEISCVGVEPAENVSKIAQNKGINTINAFFNSGLAINIINDYKKADLIIANNVFAHVPDINDFVLGIKELLSDTGVLTIEVPYLKNLINFNQFDTIYHEHIFYYSLSSINKILMYHDLVIYDVEELNTHGGSLRVFAKHEKNSLIQINPKVMEKITDEDKLGMNDFAYYNDFSNSVECLKFSLIKTILDIKEKGKKVIGYGAPGKGNTLLNYCGIKQDLVEFTVDKNPIKQNTFLPGSRIPVYDVTKIKDEQPDYIFILPWNLKEEIMNELKYVRKWDAKFIIPIPKVEII